MYEYIIKNTMRKVMTQLLDNRTNTCVKL